MTILKPTRIQSSKIHWAGYEGVVEISDLGRSFQFGRVYDDACDEGVTVISERTGKEIVFALNGRDMDESGEDLCGWNLVAVTPGFKHLKLLIIND